jgi:hypothetical protein
MNGCASRCFCVCEHVCVSRCQHVCVCVCVCVFTHICPCSMCVEGKLNVPKISQLCLCPSRLQGPLDGQLLFLSSTGKLSLGIE